MAKRLQSTTTSTHAVLCSNPPKRKNPFMATPTNLTAIRGYNQHGKTGVWRSQTFCPKQARAGVESITRRLRLTDVAGACGVRHAPTPDAASPGHTCQANQHFRGKGCCAARRNIRWSCTQSARWSALRRAAQIRVVGCERRESYHGASKKTVWRA